MIFMFMKTNTKTSTNNQPQQSLCHYDVYFTKQSATLSCQECFSFTTRNIYCFKYVNVCYIDHKYATIG